MPEQTILLVEDDPFNRDILREILEDFPEFNIVETANGQEALAWLTTHGPPALVLLDMMMPQMDGYTMLGELKQRGLLDRMRVIGVSARAREGDQAKALQAGCWRYLTKPFDIAAVEEAVHAGLTEPR